MLSYRMFRAANDPYYWEQAKPAVGDAGGVRLDVDRAPAVPNPAVVTCSAQAHRTPPRAARGDPRGGSLFP
jgi:hypothetical protein